jgi:hypothetical protein
MKNKKYLHSATIVFIDMGKVSIFLRFTTAEIETTNNKTTASEELTSQI